MSKPPKAQKIGIHLRGIEAGVHPIELRTDASVLELPMFQGEMLLSGTLEKTHDRVAIDLAATALAQFECSRCTEPVTHQISAPVHVELVPGGRVHAELPGGEGVYEYDPHLDRSFDIADDVRDALGLALPMKPLCRPDCKGLCPVCGTNWNYGSCDCEPVSSESSWTSTLRGLQQKMQRDAGGSPSAPSE